MKGSLATIVLLIVGVSAAHAADIYNPGLKDTPSVTPSGTALEIWVGVLGGYNFQDDKLKATDDYGNSATIDSLGRDGLFGEVQLGADYHVMGRIVLGVQGGLNLGNAEFKTTVDGTDLVSAEQDWGYVFGPRLGLMLSPDTLFYVSGGIAGASMDDIRLAGGDHLKVPDFFGYYGELGFESRLYDNWYLKGLGRYVNYGEETLVDERNFSVKTDTSALVGLFGITYKLPVQ